MSDKPQDIGTDSKSQREKDVIDYNHELAGGENGRINRFSVDGPTHLNLEEQEKRKAKKRQFISMLAYMLENDRQYRQMYFELETKLEEAESQVDEALLKINQKLEDIRYQLEHADELGLSEEQKIELRRKQEEFERHKQEILDYKHDVLNPIRQRMDDENHPPTKDEFQGFEDRIDRLRPDYLSNSRNTPSSVSADISDKPDFSAAKLCDVFCMAHDDTQAPLTASDKPNFAPVVLGK